MVNSARRVYSFLLAPKKQKSERKRFFQRDHEALISAGYCSEQFSLLPLKLMTHFRKVSTLRLRGSRRGGGGGGAQWGWADVRGERNTKSTVPGTFSHKRINPPSTNFARFERRCRKKDFGHFLECYFVSRKKKDIWRPLCFYTCATSSFSNVQRCIESDFYFLP